MKFLISNAWIVAALFAIPIGGSATKSWLEASRIARVEKLELDSQLTDRKICSRQRLPSGYRACNTFVIVPAENGEKRLVDLRMLDEDGTPVGLQVTNTKLERLGLAHVAPCLEGGCVYITRTHPAWKDFMQDEMRIGRR